MPRDLGTNQIQPAAQPVSTFVTPTVVDPAQPARPTQVQLSDTQIATIGTGGRGSVEGGNGGLVLAQALTRFNQNLAEVAGKGLGMYASNEYRKGQNEAYKASALVQRQMDQASIEYASENRALARKDPLAAMAMDTVNPFRLAGRKNALSQLAATEIPNAMLLAYEKAKPELSKLDPGDPKINELKAQAIDGVLSRYGLTPDEPGFLDYVVPVLNRSWERVTAQHMSDRQDWLKSTIPVTLPLTLMAKAREALANGGTPAQAAAIVTRLKDQELSKLGLPSDVIAKEEEVINSMLEAALIGAPPEDGGDPVPDEAMLQILGMVEVGDPAGDPNGIRPTVEFAFRADIYYERERRESAAWTSDQRRREMGSREFSSDVIAELAGLPDGPKKQEKIKELLNSDDPDYQGLDAGERARLIEQGAGTAENLDARGYDSTGFEDWMLELEERYGNDWDPNEAAEEFQGMIETLPPGEEREDAQRRFLDLKRRKNREKEDLPSADINKALDARIRANIEREYPGILGADSAGLDIGQYLRNKDADAAESAARQRSAYSKHVYAKINAKRAELGRPLSPLESQQAIDEALNEYGKSDPEGTKKHLFPGGTSGAPTSVPGGKNKPPATQGGAKPEAGKPGAQAAPAFPVSRLGDVPEERLRNWRRDPIVSQDSLVTLTEQVLAGGDFPKQLKQAARKAGTSPGQFLLDQLKLYPGTIDLKPEQRKQILRQGQQQASATRYSDSLVAHARSILGEGAGWMARVLIPAGRANAEPITFVPRGQRTTPAGTPAGGGYIATTGFGKSADGQTQTLHGIKGRNGYDAGHGVGNDHVHHATDPKVALELAAYLKKKGWPITEFKGWSQRVGTHSETGGHHTGEAFDIPVGVEQHPAVLKDIDAFYASRGKGRRSTSRKPSTPTRSRVSSASPKGEAGWDTVATAAQVAGAKFPALVAAMWALESGWGRTPSGRHNYFNQKGAGKSVGTVEYINGKATKVKDQFLNFRSFAHSLDTLVEWWFKDYKGHRGINNARSMSEAIQMLAQQGYATVPNYGVELRRILRQKGVRF